MAYEVHTWTITGTSPLMQSNPREFITNSQDDENLTVKKKYDDEEEARLRVYRDPDNPKVFCHPAVAFRKAMSNAVKGRKFGKKAARMVIVGAVFPIDEWCVITNGTGKPAKKYEIDVRPAVIGKSRIRRCRPKFTKWGMELHLEIDTEMISLAQVTEALNIAGKIIGIGEMRPDPNDGKSGIGTFGRFVAALKA